MNLQNGAAHLDPQIIPRCVGLPEPKAKLAGESCQRPACGSRLGRSNRMPLTCAPPPSTVMDASATLVAKITRRLAKGREKRLVGHCQPRGLDKRSGTVKHIHWSIPFRHALGEIEGRGFKQNSHLARYLRGRSWSGMRILPSGSNHAVELQP